MRLLPALLLLALPLAGCVGPGGNPNLRPPCEDSRPVHIEIVTDLERYPPGFLMNITLLLNNSGPNPATLTYRSWELSMKSFDGRAIKTFFRDFAPDGPASKQVPSGAARVLQERWQPFRVLGELTQPLTPGTYYLCAVLSQADGSVLSGARPFVAEPPPRTL